MNGSNIYNNVLTSKVITWIENTETGSYDGKSNNYTLDFTPAKNVDEIGVLNLKTQSGSDLIEAVSLSYEDSMKLINKINSTKGNGI